MHTPQKLLPVGGAQMFRADTDAWHVTGKPKTTTFHLLVLCALLQMILKWITH
jgi:hypothetical protein